MTIPNSPGLLEDYSLSSSTLAQTCPRKFYYEARLDAHSSEFNPAFFWGRIFHGAIERVLQFGISPKKAFDYAFLFEMEKLDPDTKNLVFKEYNKFQQIILHFILYFESDLVEFFNGYVVEAVELPWELPIIVNNYEETLRGRFDLVMRNTKTNKTRIIDFKLVSNVKSAAAATEYRLQSRLYGYAAYKLYGDNWQDITYLYVGKTPPKTTELKSKQNAGRLSKALSQTNCTKVWYITTLRALEQNPKDPYYRDFLNNFPCDDNKFFRLYSFNYKAQHIAEVEQSLIQMLTIKQIQHLNDVWPPTFPYHDCRTCHLKSLCSMDRKPENTKLWLEINTRPRTDRTHVIIHCSQDMEQGEIENKKYVIEENKLKWL